LRGKITDLLASVHAQARAEQFYFDIPIREEHSQKETAESRMNVHDAMQYAFECAVSHRLAISSE
jgi:hypothetical protein